MVNFCLMTKTNQVAPLNLFRNIPRRKPGFLFVRPTQVSKVESLIYIKPGTYKICYRVQGGLKGGPYNGFLLLV